VLVFSCLSRTDKAHYGRPCPSFVGSRGLRSARCGPLPANAGASGASAKAIWSSPVLGASNFSVQKSPSYRAQGALRTFARYSPTIRKEMGDNHPLIVSASQGSTSTLFKSIDGTSRTTRISEICAAVGQEATLAPSFPRIVTRHSKADE
jgi:hypothetical protein